MTPLTLLMLDYDGTLTPIVPNYQDAQISNPHLEALKSLAANPCIQLAIVSGRSIEQLRVFLEDLSGLPIYLVGLHGGQIFDLKSNTFLLSPAPQYRATIQTLSHALAQNPAFSRQGIQLENKAFSLGVHFRQASPQDAQTAIDALKTLFEQLGLNQDFSLKPGKQLMEVVPKAFNKGTGVEKLIELLETPLKLTYIGDDITDFDAFRVVSAHGGQTCYVGTTLPEGSPEVTQRLDSVNAVYTWLQTYLDSC